jgi:hypothetical protein
MQTRTAEPNQASLPQAGPYRPCLLDRFMDAVQRLPIPYGLTYLGLFLVQSLLVHVLSWVDGWLPPFKFNVLVFLFPLWLWLPLAMITYLKSVSLDALTAFAPLLDVDEERLKGLAYEFTVMPSTSVALSGLFWAIVYILLSYVSYDAFYGDYGLGPLASVVVFVEGLISYSFGSAIYYYSLRQLRLVSATVKMVEQFNLFRLDPVYAFSRLTSQIGVSWMVLVSLTLVLFPIELAKVPVLAILVLQLAMAVAAFVLPLWFVNRRLVAEKRRLLGEVDRRIESTLARLHLHVDENELAPMEQIDHALTCLQAERAVLRGIPTWPWRASTLTGFFSAIATPIIVFLIQLAVEKWLGR